MYITPRVLIQQEFLQVPVYRTSPLPAFIIGPNYALTRYNDPLEKPHTRLGTLNGVALETGNSYQYAVDTVYDFPNVPAGGDVDHDYTKVYAEAVEARYFPLAALGDAGVGSDAVVRMQSPSGNYYTNKVRFSAITLQTQNGHSRSSVFSNRDVMVGDIIELTDDLNNTVKAKIKALEAETSAVNEDLASQNAPVVASGTLGTTNGGGTRFTSTGAGFEADQVIGKYLTIEHLAGSAGSYKILDCPNSTTLTLDRVAPAGTSLHWHVAGVYGDANNASYSTGSVSIDPSGTTNTTVDVAFADDTYFGYASKGVLSDVYTVNVTTAGDESAVRFSVSSENGAFVMREGLSLDEEGVLLLDDGNNNMISLAFTQAGVPSIAFTTSNAWEVTLHAAVSPTNPATTGTYAGPVDMVYTVRVERGGAFYNGQNSSTCARLLISASDIDTSSVVLPRSATSFNVGSFGVTASFASAVNNGGLVLGDIYYIPVYAATKGAVTIVELSEDMPEAMRSLAETITAKLYLTQKSIQIPAVKDLLTDARNWTQEDSYITINEGITSYDNNLISDGAPARLPIRNANLFVEHRDLLQTYVTAIDSVRSLADVIAKLGTVHPDNPLAQGVYDAVLNSSNQIVYYVGVATNDLAGYTQAIKISEKSDKVYSFVPLSFNRAIQDAVVAHVNAYSTPEVGRWRIAWISVEDQKSKTMFDLKPDGTPYKATIKDNPDVSGTQYNLFEMEGAQFLDPTNPIRPNDSVRVNFRLNADGVLIYDEYIVDRVKTNTSLLLTRALSSPINTAVKAQVVRNYTKSERANNIAHIGGDYNNRRVRCVFPDTFKYAGVTKQGYFAAAGLAGLRGGVVPHQGLTNTEYLGADDLSKVVIEFSQDDLDVMAEQGIWLLTQEVVGATPYVRHQLTSDERSLNTSEDSITTNVDSISYALKRTLAPFIGRYNINPTNITLVRAAIDAELRFRATSTFTARAGNQLASYTPKDDIIRVEQNSTYKDRLDVEVRLNVPYPLNYLNLLLIVG